MPEINDRFLSEEKAAEYYKSTPVYPESAITSGMCAHIGKGVFLARCRSCMKAVYSYGPIPSYAGIGKHEYKKHHLDVPGINLAMMN